MRCPKCGYANKDEAIACLMCYAMLKKPQGKIEPIATPPSSPPPTPIPEAIPTPPPLTSEIPPITPSKPSVEPERRPVKKTKGFIATWWEVISSPTNFFDKMHITGSLTEPYVFALINILIMALGIFLITLVGGKAIREMFRLSGIPGGFSLITLIPFLLFWAVFGSAVLFIQAGILNICAKLLMGEGNYRTTFKALAYSYSINVFEWIPFINLLTALYGLYILIVGLKKVHNLSTGKVILAILLPGLLFLAIFIMVVVSKLLGKS